MRQLPGGGEPDPDLLPHLGLERLGAGIGPAVDDEAEVGVADEEPVVAVDGPVARVGHDLERAVEALADLVTVPVAVVPVRAGGHGHELVGHRPAGLDRLLGDAGDAVHLVGQHHAVPVDGGALREVVGKHHPDLVALDDPDRRPGNGAVEGEGLLLHPRRHVPGVGGGVELEHLGAVVGHVVLGEDRAVAPGGAGNEAGRPAAAGAGIGGDRDVAGQLVRGARVELRRGGRPHDERALTGGAGHEHTHADQVHGQDRGHQEMETHRAHVVVLLAQCCTGTPSSGPGGRVLDVVVDGAGGASGSPAVDGGVLPSGFSTTTFPSM